MRKAILLLITSAVLAGGSGCAALRKREPVGAVSVVSNPFFVPANNEEAVWERTVDVVHNYFDIARENRLEGVIESHPKAGASALEPWHRDSVGIENRLESTLQTIRRRAFVKITPTEGGYLVGAEVFKEREDVRGRTENSPGGATFQEARPLQRNLNLVLGQTAASGWISLGRDDALENRLLRELHTSLQR
jgi:hypothetical protein